MREFELYESSSVQKRIFTIHQMEGETIAYNIPIAMQIEGLLDINRLEIALQKLAERHEGLRTCFRVQNGELLQKVYAQMDCALKYTEWEGRPLEAYLLEWIQPFALTELPLWRAELVKIGAEQYLFLFDIHHIISDAFSNMVIFRELMQLYFGMQLPPLKAQYVDYAIWQNDLVDSEVMQQMERYWLNQFAGEIPVLQLPGDYVRPKVMDYRGGVYRFSFGGEILHGLRQLAERHGATMHMLLMTVYYILLAKYAGQDDLVVGLPISGRPDSALDGVVGMFINTLPIRTCPQAEKRFGEFFAEVRDTLIKAYDHQYYDLELLVERLHLQRDPGRNPLFDTVFGYHGAEVMVDAQLPGLKCSSYALPYQFTKFDLTLTAAESENRVECTLNYWTGLLSEATMVRMGRHFVRLAEAAVANPSARLADLDMLSQEEKQELLAAFNDTVTDFPYEKTVVQVFEEMVAVVPEAVACVVERVDALNVAPRAERMVVVSDGVTYGEEKMEVLDEATCAEKIADVLNEASGTEERIDVRDAVTCAKEKMGVAERELAGQGTPLRGWEQLTYDQLNRKANQLARRLRTMGVGRDVVVGIMVPRSIEMMIGIMGIIKAGGAYLPIDPEYPVERIRYMLAESQSPVILTIHSLTEKLGFGCPMIALDDPALYQGEDTNLPQVNQPDNLLYIIYTSGTTGKPKGVMIDHRSVLNLVTGLHARIYSRVPGSLRVTLLAAYVFDASVQQIFGALLQGHSLYIVPEEARLDGGRLLAFYREAAIDISDGTPAHLSLLIHAMEPGERLPVKHFIIGGEALSRQLVADFRALCCEPKPEITNIYGPAECCVDTTAFLVDGTFSHSLPTVPIGSPLPNRKIYVLDQHQKLVPVGVAGEMYISGEGVGRGYLADEELTKMRFIPDPFESEREMYKTGDLVRWLPDGNIEFLGRMDHQVKIRGYRIELDDIVVKLLEHPDIHEAVVFDRLDEGGEKYLCAYLVAEPAATGIVVRDYLMMHLPAYMVPAYYVMLEKFPLTVSGKVDRRSLLQLEAIPVMAKEHVAPRTALEAKIAELWQSVLHVDQVGVRDHFFEIGGHSLKAMVLVSRIQKELKRQVSVKELFTYPTVEELARFLAGQEESAFRAIEPAEVREFYPLSSAQKRLFILHQLMPDSTNYNMPFAVYIDGPLKFERFATALAGLTRRHEALRTSFALVDEVPVQRVLERVDAHFDYSEVNVPHSIGNSVEEGEAITRAIAQFIRPFDLTQAPLFRVGLFKVSDTRHLLVFDMHHIISDGVSMEILFSEFAALYSGAQLPPLRIQYKDYAVWQNETVGERMQEEEAYWLRQFAENVPVLNLPTDEPRPALMDFAGERVHCSVDPELTRQLRAFSTHSGVTMFMTLFAAYSTLLGKYSGDEDIVIGTVVAGRPHTDLEPVIGMFVNTLAMRSRPVADHLLIDFLQAVKEQALAAFEYQNYPFEMLVDQLEVARDLSRNPIFDVSFAYHASDLATTETMGMGDLTVTRYSWSGEMAKFDLTLGVRESEEELTLEIEYRTSLFHRATIERMAGHLLNLLEEMVAEPARPLAELQILSIEERDQLLHEFNDSAFPIPSHVTYHRLFEEQVARTPERVAVVCQKQHLTYRELNAAANRVAWYLKRRGVGRTQIVGIMVDPSVEMLVGILGIIKSGAAYLPIDPGYPESRIQYMLSDSSTQYLLTQYQYANRVTFAGEVICLDEHGSVGEIVQHSAPGGHDIHQHSIANEDRMDTDDTAALRERRYTAGEMSRWKQDRTDAAFDEVASASSEQTLSSGSLYAAFPEDQAGPNDLVYVIYTSGSTGRPKGVMIEHHSLVNTITWYVESYQITEEDRCGKYAAPGFDASVAELFPPLIRGAALHMIPKEMRLDFDQMNRYFEEHGITLCFLPTQVCELFMTRENHSLRLLFTGGEKLKYYTPHDYRLSDNYGPTENTVVTTAFDVDRVDGNIPIGKPIFNTRIYILDAHQNLQPIGVPGELCISGEGLARGYWQRPELTAEMFVANPYEPGMRMYRTGDLARWLPDGNIEFLGRMDHQVKIRGYRIEIGELEALLLNHQAVEDAVVRAWEERGGHGHYLAGYIVWSAAPISIAELREYLAQYVPEYMIPAYFIEMEDLPLSPNGKVDRKALPEPDRTADRETAYVPPSTVTEEKLAAIWANLLQIEPIGVHDNFFALGGHSLKATTLMARMNNEFAVEIPLREIFSHPTVYELARVIDSAKPGIYHAMEPVEPRAYYPVSSAQKRIFILHQMNPQGTHYNMPAAMVIEGDLDRKRLTEALRTMVRRHESLRTSFTLVDGVLMQIIQEEAEVPLELMTISETEWAEAGAVQRLVASMVKPFDLSETPLFRVGLVPLAEERHLLFFDLHHIIADGVSVEILFRECIRLYDGQELRPLRIQYKDYAVWQLGFFASDALAEEKAYWLRQFADGVPTLQLPTDYPRPRVMDFAGDHVPFTIGRELTAQLTQLSREEGATLYMTLLAVYSLLLARYSGEGDIVIGSPIAGRPHVDLEGIIGMFVNTLALRHFPSGAKGFRAYLREVKEGVLQALEYQNYPFDELVEQMQLERDQSRNPLFDVLFNFQELHQSKKNGRMEIGGLRLEPFSFPNPIAKFDIAFPAILQDGEIQSAFEYRSRLFKRSTIERMTQHFLRLLEAVTADPSTQIADLEMLSLEEKEELLVSFNDTARVFPREKTAVQVFEEMVAQAPEEVACVDEQGQLTYGELNEKANQLARRLRASGIRREQIVGLIIHRSMEMIIGIIGIIKAGGAYLPIDPAYPMERIRYMLEESGSPLLLTSHTLAETMNFGLQPIILDDPALYAGDGANLPRVNEPTDLLYIIYTSGTTGNPKGVMIDHRSVLNLLVGLQERIYERFPGRLRVTLLAAYVFDASVQQIFAALLLGHALCIVPEEARTDGQRLLQFYQDAAIDISDGTPAHIGILVQTMEMGSPMPVKHFVIGGEALPQQTVREFLALCAEPKPEITNIYGPAECCVDSTAFLINGESSLTDLLTTPIGSPLANKVVYILDQNRHLVPLGVTGEIYISGEGMSRGYLHAEELTEMKFVPDPFVPGRKMYKTGDLARWLPDGNIEFLGRLDHQVKIRGYRIELGDITAKLLEHPRIHDAIVLDRDDMGEKYLCAYLVAEPEVTGTAIREHLLTKLPEYMVPAHYLLLEKIPLTVNGKVDRRALLQMEALPVVENEYVAPRTEAEERLAQLWEKVLHVERVGMYDNFFALGGHSLKATTLMTMVKKEFGVTISLREFFSRPTIAELAQAIARERPGVYAAIEPAEPRMYYPVSSAQKRIYILSQFRPLGTHYNIPAAMMMEGRLDRIRFTEVIRALVQRHESLRTLFVLVDGEPMQRILEDVEVSVEVVTLPQEERNEGEWAREQILKMIKPFDLTEAPLFRVGFVQLSDARQILFFDLHHIIADGVSMQILFQECMALYSGEELTPLRIQYKDFSVWQWEFYASEAMAEEEKFWLRQFADEVPTLPLPTDYPRPRVLEFAGDRVDFTLDEELTARLMQLTGAEGATLFMTLLAAYSLLLSKYSGEEDIIIGSPIAGRPHADLEGIIGMFVNTLALRNAPAGEKTFRTYLQEVKDRTLQALEHQNYPFDGLVEKLQVERDQSRNPLFDVMFNYQEWNEALGSGRTDGAGISFEPYSFITPVAKFDLTLSAVWTDGRIEMVFEYRTALFRPETIERMVQHWRRLLIIVVDNPDLRLKDISLLSDEERQRMMVGLNSTQMEFPVEKTIVDLIHEQAERAPRRIALCFRGEEITYHELDQQATSLAHTLWQRGVGPECPVGIMTEPSKEMIIGILAILKAGGAYVPIDPIYPEERVQYILKDCGATCFLTQSHLRGRVKYTGETLLLDEELGCQALDRSSRSHGSSEEMTDGAFTVLQESSQHGMGESWQDALPWHGSYRNPALAARNLAYIIYTSGSTGLPKGVMVEHRALVNFALWFVERYNYTEEDRCTQYAGMSFDASVSEIFPCLIAGAALYPVPKELRLDLDVLNEYLHRNRITVTFLPTPVCEQFMTRENHCLRVLSTGGDQLKQYVPHSYRLMNNYGPTENTVVIALFEIDQAYETIPIGKPVANNQIYIVDRYGALVPEGVAGELCVAGENLARGYWNRPDLTAERFVANPFVPGTRMYRTGDRARWLPSGDLLFLGRMDFQVKIRGYRIELGEIESLLIRHEMVREAVVLARDEQGGGKVICAYVVWTGSGDVDTLREYLSQYLPEYMLPAHFIILESMPLTPNGKVDRRALPEPDLSLSRAQAYVPPSDPVELRLAAIWSELLGVPRVGMYDNFFELGGHSLKATTLMGRLKKEFEVEIALQEMFTHPTIHGLANVIRQAKRSTFIVKEPVEERAYYPVSSAQKRMFILSQFEPNGLHYNIPLAMLVEGKWDLGRFNDVIHTIVQRHEAFRTSFVLVDGEPMQIVHPELDVQVEERSIPEWEATRERLEELILSMVKPFDLTQAPLFRVGAVQCGEEKYLLFFDVHHIIADGTSMQILFRECIELYVGKTLAPLRIQYKDYSAWQERLLASAEMEEMERFWLVQFADGIPTLQLPTDDPRPRVMEYAGDRLTFTASSELTKVLLHHAEEEGATMFMLLLAVYSVFLGKYAGVEDVVVGSPVAGRSHADLEGVIGMFVNTLPFRNQPAGEKTFRECLREVRERAVAVFANQEYPFEMLVDRLQIERDQSRNPIFDTVFSYQEMSRRKREEGRHSGELTFTPLEPHATVSKFDLTLSVVLEDGELMCGFEYRTRLFRKATVERMARHFVRLLETVSKAPDRPLKEISLLSEEEQIQLMRTFNATGAPLPVGQTVVDLFHEQAAKTPDAVAVYADGMAMSYQELDQVASDLAWMLMGKGVGPDQPVGILAESSMEFIVGTVAILKAGGAYVPIDPIYPEERIAYILQDCGANIVLTKEMYRAQLHYSGEIIVLDADDRSVEGKFMEASMEQGLLKGAFAESASAVNLKRHPLLAPHNLAYLIYTSGSTGAPKGVMIEHHSLLNLALWFKQYYHMTPEDRWTQFAGVSFDASVSEIFPALISGAALYPIPQKVRYDLDLLNEYFETHQITIAFLPTPVCEQFMSKENHSLRYLTTGGDQLKQYIPRGYRVTNNYGPTENTCITAVFEVDALYPTIPIGKPVQNNQIYILDRYNQLVPIGVVGELCVSGEHLARGYWNRPDLTDERFVPNPFIPGTRMYRTGDLARWLPDGNLEYLGRMDQQVKIRGYRIELGEIESQILHHPSVKDVAVVAHREQHGGEKYLCAYIVLQGQRAAGDELAADEIRLACGDEAAELTNIGHVIQDLKQYLKIGLPDYMIPTYFLVMKSLPLTTNGKVDRKALPEPTQPDHRETFVTPETECEKQLALIWSELLGMDEISAQANFFALGGHSLKATVLANRIADTFGVTLPLSEIFDHPTICELAQRVESVRGGVRIAPTLSNLLLLRRGEDPEQHIFLVHGGDGDVGIYHQLVTYLPPRYNYWGIRATHYTEEAAAVLTLTEVATEYRVQIEQIQPQGPYRFISWCIGGTISFEIARQFEETGSEIALFAMLDAPAPWPDPETLIRSDADSTWEQVQRYRGEQSMDAAQIKRMIPSHIARTIPDFDHADLDAVVGHLQIIRTLDRIRNQYRPASVLQSTVHFLSAEQMGQDGALWNRYTAQPIQLYVIPGDHFTMLTIPGVLPMAKEIIALLNQHGQSAISRKSKPRGEE